MVPTGEPATRKRRDRPPPKVVLAIGVALLAINHLSVVFGNGLQAEALMMGCWLLAVGGWVLVSPRSFDAVWAWADRSGRRIIGMIVLSLAAGVAAAEAVARLAYGQSLFG
jgi:hypothetical protein